MSRSVKYFDGHLRPHGVELTAKMVAPQYLQDLEIEQVRGGDRLL